MQKTNPFYLLGIVTLLLLSFLLFGIKRAAAGHDPSQPAAANHPSTIPLKVDRLDPSIDAIIPANASAGARRHWIHLGGRAGMGSR